MLITTSGPGCSKQMTSLVNVSLKLQILILNTCSLFFVEKMCDALSQKLLSFFQQNLSVFLVIKW